MKNSPPLLKQYPQLHDIQQIAKRKKIKVYLVGGFVRDYLLGRADKDFDFAVSKNAIALARVFAKKIKGAFVLLDKDRGCARVAKKNKGVITTYDFADFRARTLKQDLSRRDFTINTLCVDLNDLKATTTLRDVLLDYKNGLKDTKAQRIKMASPSSFKEDPLRLLRAFSLQAGLGFRIEAKTLVQIKRFKDRINDVSYERIREELFKVLMSPNAAANFKQMDKISLLTRVIPQITVMDKVKQGGYHHLDVWPHSLETLAQLEKLFVEKKDDPDIREYITEPLSGDHSRLAVIKLAALLHDIGKPETRKKENGKLSFHGHERVGRSIVRIIAKKLKLATKERFALEDMVFWHLRPGYLSNFKNPSERMIFRYFRDTGEEAASILLLSMADQRATRGPVTTESDQKHHRKICERLLKRFFDKRKEKPFVRLIDGNDLIKQLKLKPSPLFGKILKDVEEKQVLGKIKTKKEALKTAKEIALNG